MLGSDTKVKLKGTMNTDDFKVLKANTTITHLDLYSVDVVGKIIIRTTNLTDGYETQTGNAIPMNAFGSPKKEIDKYGVNTVLQYVKLPKTVTTVGESSFDACTSLAEVVFPEGLIDIWAFAFNECALTGELKFPENMKNIGMGAFASCEKLTGTIVIPKKLTEVLIFAFYKCTNITGVTLHGGLETIDQGAFQATGLTSLDLPEGIENIGQYAFASCEKLKGSLVIPESVGRIFEGAFESSKFDGTLTIPKGVHLIEDRAFNNTDFKKIELNWVESSDFPWEINQRGGRWGYNAYWFPTNFETSGNKTDYFLSIPAGSKAEYINYFPREGHPGESFFNLKERN